MKLRFLGSLVLAFSGCVCSCAALGQDFPDTTKNHWAYQALQTLKKDGLLNGYPDGLFRGARPASRYEMAVALHAVYLRLVAVERVHEQHELWQQQQRNALKIQDLAAEVKESLKEYEHLGPDLTLLKRLAAEFEKELTSLGVDIEQLKLDLATLAKRLGTVEAYALPIDVHGDANLLALGGGSSSHRPGITVDGRPVGVADRVFVGPTYVPVGFSQDLSIFHEAALRISGNTSKQPGWHATLVVGNTIGAGGALSALAMPSQSTTAPDAPFAQAREGFYFQDFSVDMPLSRTGMTAQLGRVGFAIDPYLFQRPDTSPYFTNGRWDDGRWTFDGVVLDAPVGAAKMSVFAGRQSSPKTSDGTQLQPMNAGAVATRFTPGGPGASGMRPLGLPVGDASAASSAGIPVDQHLGINLKVPITNSGRLDLAYIWLESNAGINALGLDPNTSGGSRAVNRAQVFGGDFAWKSGSIGLNGGYSQSNLYNGSAAVVNSDNYAWHAEAGYSANRWGVKLGYREIQPLFGAPGDWGRIGLWWNPTDIRGPEAAVHVNVNDQLSLRAKGEWYSGLGKSVSTPAGTFSGLNANDRIQRYTAELGYKINSSLELSLGAEFVDWKLKDRSGLFSGGNPSERWYNLGVGYNLNSNAKISFLWQVSDYRPGTDGNGNPVNGFALPTKDGKASGNLITSQLTIKF